MRNLNEAIRHAHDDRPLRTHNLARDTAELGFCLRNGEQVHRTSHRDDQKMLKPRADSTEVAGELERERVRQDKTARFGGPPTR